MRININTYLKLLNPLLVAIFSAYFVATLLFFTLPKRGINFINTDITKSNSNTRSSQEESKDSLNKQYIVKAIYKKYGGKSWILLFNKKLSKTIALQEGEKINNYILKAVYKNRVILQKDKQNIVLKLKIKEKNINDIIKMGI